MNKANIIDNNLGPVFPPQVMVGGLVFCGFGILVLFQIWYMGIIMIVLGGYVGIGVNGNRIDASGQRFKTYTKWFGIRNGKWKSMDLYPFVAVVSKQVGLTMASRGNRSMDFGESTYTICLLSQTHRTKVILRQEDTRRAAENYADFIALKLNKLVVQYEPQISAQTRERNMRRR